MLSVVVITRDEADRLPRCLASARFAEELLVVDSGSTDDTGSVARAHGARFVRADWPGFVHQRNRAMGLATQPWLLFLDADEWLTDAAADAIREALAHPGDTVAFRFARRNHWLGHPLRFGRSYPDRTTRLLRAGHGRWEGGRVHERLRCRGPVSDLVGDIGHDPYRDIDEHLRTLRAYAALAAEDLADAGRVGRLRDPLLRPPLRFVDQFLLRGGLLDGAPGLAVALLGAHYTRLKWAALLRRTR